MTSRSRTLNEHQRLTLTVEEAARLLGISRSVAYESARTYEATAGATGLPVLRLGRRLVVPVALLEGLVGERPGALCQPDSSDSEVS